MTPHRVQSFAKPPLFSVVTISFNQAEFLPRAMDSVLSQGGHVEYIVCDPGSTDGSREIIDSYGDRVAVRVFEKDAGPADGLNRGFAHATGDIYAYLNSDDTFLPGAFETVAAYLAKHPNVDVVTGHALVIDGQDRILRKAWSERFSLRATAYGASIQIQPSTFIRAEAFRRSGGFNPANRAQWDGELLIDLCKTGASIRTIDAFLSCYRLHETSITNSGSTLTRIAEVQDAGFRRIMGRPRRGYDRRLAQLFRLWKHLSHPRATWERVRKGPIFMRGV